MTSRDANSGLSGRVALVTGAASGMGEAVALALADQGVIVALADVNGEGCEKVALETRRLGSDQCQAFRFDASSKESIEQLCIKVLQWSDNKLDILVNMAGVSGGGMPLTSKSDAYERAWALNFAVNVTAQQRLARGVLGALLESERGGRIINIASTEGLGATLFNSPYVAAKHASVGLSKAMSLELASQGITVNCVCPGPIATNMTARIPHNQKELFAKRRVPARRYGVPDEVAFLVCSLADDRASYINGAVINVDGGMLANNALLPMRLPWEQTSSKL